MVSIENDVLARRYLETECDLECSVSRVYRNAEYYSDRKPLQRVDQR